MNGLREPRPDSLTFHTNIWSSQFLRNCGCFFAANRPHLSMLFQSAALAVLDWAATKHFRPGLVTVLHTFGSKLNFNCHIHIIYTLGGYDGRNGRWKQHDFVPAEALKSRFKTILLARLRRARNELFIPPEVKKHWRSKFNSDNLYVVQNELWKINWYLYVGEELDNANLTVKYIGRYAKRPCLAETRIKYYSKNEFIIKFEYKDKTTGEYEEVETDPITFIGLLVRHIPEKYFRLIRYYGAYGAACRSKIFKTISQRLIFLYGIASLLFGPPRKTWRERRMESTGVDPLKCPKCGFTMLLTEITYRTRDGTMKTISFF
jgi:hypothetical protein